MARPSGPKTRCNGNWTEAAFKSFIRGNLRRTSQKWAPIQTTLAKARVERGFYKCASCEEIVPATTKVEGKRVKNVHVDHIEPVIDPSIGWVSWDSLIERMFVEEASLQLLCDACHTVKTNQEKAIAKERRAGDNNDEF
jgi:hypothetical protein